ncbi:MFS transporter [Alsobacter soli]|uniref:Bcr/CflA family efflux transporter n=2 Tax=Alsobacter soli TaxID=2109933 RepID=A0A2T1HPZ4_9HYPH|nr:multidrug effflux MFS transporter [Alsobacter soli]PSC03738.1 MFS transporter [Alsobacter soli]
MGFKEFVALVAAMMATNALAVDSMLPALPSIGESLAIDTANQRQWIVTAYLLGFGVAQLVYGTFGDRYGRKPVLLFGFAVYVLAAAACAFAPTFGVMLAARVVQGVGAAATRVLSVSVVRDCYAGRQMARVMSLAFLVFLGVPIIAPSVGQVIVWFAPWRWIFGVLGLFGVAIGIWTALRLPETLRPENRLPISVAGVTGALRVIVTSRTAMGYFAAMTFVLGGLFGFINSAQQVFADAFHAPHLFTTIFALVAVFIAIASLVNARIVGRLGSRRVSHAALLGYIAFTTIHAAVALSGYETIWTFAVLQSGTMFCFGMVGPNFGAMAMEPLGHVAGTASSVQGFITTIGGALIGFYIGQHFDGTVAPITIGFSACGCAALVCVLWAEGGRLFKARAEKGSRTSSS